MEQRENRWLSGIRSALSKSRQTLIDPLKDAFSRSSIDETFWSEIEDALISADVGMPTTMKVVDELRTTTKRMRLSEPEQVRDALKDELIKVLEEVRPPDIAPGRLKVDIIVGVNGVGKTTSIAKIAYRFRSDGEKVLLAAADTYRAAAVEQLAIWAKRADVDIVMQGQGSDAAAVVFDAVSAAKARGMDRLIADTAGRIHTKIPLMEEIKKIKRVIEREAPDAAVQTLIVIDATTGQNGLLQARQFNDTLEIDGVVLAKLDGTAKGGIVLAIVDELRIPVLFVGTGERIEDIADFDARSFVDALLS